MPRLKLNPEVKSLFDFAYDDVVIDAYDPASRHPGPGGRLSATLPPE